MSHITRIALIGTAAGLLALAAGAELCRSVSATWDDAGQVTRTQMWTTAIDGCKQIEHQTASTRELIYSYKAGVGDQSVLAVRGVDCNCDLFADGEEGQFSEPPSGNGAHLEAVCYGPIAEKAEQPDPFRAFDEALKRGAF